MLMERKKKEESIIPSFILKTKQVEWRVLSKIVVSVTKGDMHEAENIKELWIY